MGKSAKEKFNEEVKVAIKRDYKSQKNYAKKIMRTESTLSNYITGKRDLDFEFITQIATDLNLDLNHIFKTNTEKLYKLSKEEIALHKALNALPEEKRIALYADFMSIIGLIRN